jgi:hypothetical protein
MVAIGLVLTLIGQTCASRLTVLPITVAATEMQGAQTHKQVQPVDATKDTVAMESPAVTSTSVKRRMVDAAPKPLVLTHWVEDRADVTTDTRATD